MTGDPFAASRRVSGRRPPRDAVEGTTNWSDHEEERYQLRRRRQRVLQRLMLAALTHSLAAMALEVYSRHHRVLGVLTIVAYAVSIAGLGSAAVLGARWGLNSNAAESWSTGRRRTGWRAQRDRRAQAIRAGTWRPRP